jgi:hypothetical protein
MESLEFSDVQGEKQRRLVLGKRKDGTEIAVTLKYAAPREADKFRRTLEREGIGKRDADGFKINTGREKDYYAALAKHYVLGWEGVTNAGEPMDYSPESMAVFLSGRGDLLKIVHEAIAEDEAFFGTNGSGQT